MPNTGLECLLPVHFLCGGFHQWHLYVCEGLGICYLCIHNMKYTDHFMYAFVVNESEKISKNGCLLVQCLICNAFLCHLGLSELLDFLCMASRHVILNINNYYLSIVIHGTLWCCQNQCPKHYL